MIYSIGHRERFLRARTLIRALAPRLGVDQPRIEGCRSPRSWHIAKRNGDSIIRIGTGTAHSAEETAIHELAHHVNWRRHRGTGHRGEFPTILAEVVRVSGLRYRWGLEYVTIARAAERGQLQAVDVDSIIDALEEGSQA